MRRNFKRVTIVIVIVGSVLLAKKAYELSRAPSGAKDCSFVWPHRNATQDGVTINDASCLNATKAYRVVQVSTEDDIAKALAFAKAHQLKVTSAGQRHSMGGQSFSPNGLVLDMRGLNKMSLNKETMTLRVQSGATWQEVQRFLDKEQLSVKAMQSINIFTVGGTLSVNAHGIARGPAQVATTVKQLRVVTANGETVTASLSQNEELFRHVLGGYGLFGVIVDADLEVVPNEIYAWKTTYLDYKDFPDFYATKLKGNAKIPMTYSRLSMAPSSYLTQTAVHTFEQIQSKATPPTLQEARHTWITRLLFNFSKTGSVGRWLRWVLETRVEPHFHPCATIDEALSSDVTCAVSRNQEMYDPMAYLKNDLRDTDILQEYFIPADKMVAFVDGLKEVVGTNSANLLNVTIRLVEKDTITALPYAKEDRLAFVLYFNQRLNEDDSRLLQKTTTDLIDLVGQLGGTFYLPYQLYYSKEQLRKAYPESDAFFATKKKYDPDTLFINIWHEKYR